MTINASFKNISCLLVGLVFTANVYSAVTDISTVPLNTYSAPSSTDVKPNVFFVLDDSGSMDWDFMPDWACASYSTRNSSCSSTGQNPSSARSEYLFKNAGYNGIYYNPKVTYTPPIAVDSSGVANTTTYPSMTGTSTATGADSSAKPNWNAVKDDAYGIQSSSSATSNLVNHADFFTIVPGQYCDKTNLKTCTNATASSSSYPYPAIVRWCDSSALTNCRAAFGSPFTYARAPSPRTATITVSGSTSTSVSQITVNGLGIMSGTAASSTTSSTVASGIVAQINACTYSLTGTCGVVGYSASSSGSVVTISAPAAITYTPVVTQSGSMTITATVFVAGAVPGDNLRTIITSSVTSYAYPGTSAKATTRTDCAGTTCTYAEEMTNYANWWTYYKSRMQMMKSAASNAFSLIDNATDISNSVSRFRLGYMSINNNTGSDFVNLGEFKTAQKGSWYSKLTSASPGSSTPLRAALSTAGQLYGGKLNSSSINGSPVTDPLQYSCQQNYTILSTDGFWNESSGFYKLDGSTNVGNQDAALPRPYYDGGSGQLQSRTSTLQSQTITSQTQKQTSQLQATTVHLQSSTKTSSNTSYTAYTDTSSCTYQTFTYPKTKCQYGTTTTTTGVPSCTLGTKTTSTLNGTVYNGPTVVTACNTVVTSSWANVASCTATTTPDANGYTTQCQTVITSTGPWTNASSCTVTSTNNCQYTTPTAWSNVSSCMAVAQSSPPNYTVATATDCQTIASGGTSNTLADVAAYYYNTDLRSATATAPDATGTCTGPIISPATTANDLCQNNVPANGRDVAVTQHMTTFTLGLGSQGEMIYAPTDGKDYWNDTSGDFFDVYKGNTANTTSGICSWQSSGACNWPTPASNSNTNIDDLWHAAVNGHGTYFSATDPASLSAGLTNALSTIANTPRPGAAAAAASSNPNFTSSDNYVFSPSYVSVNWTGELIRQQITNSGTFTAQNWSAMKLLDCATTSWKAATAYIVGTVYAQGSYCYSVTANYTSGATFGATDTSNTAVVNVDETATTKVPATPLAARTIYTKSGAALIPFQWTNLVGAGLSSNFTKPAISYVSTSTGLSQFCVSGLTCLTSTQQNNNTIATGGAAGEALVNFLRGDRSNEGTYFRTRTHVLGDIVSSEARYEKTPLYNYGDAGYSDYKTLQASRNGTVYIGSNDGMLHAFDATSGQESWAYIPSLVLPNIYRLADLNYKTQHQYFVDATPELGDICPNAPSSTCSGGQWKTILVGGLNDGGKGYYALDITNPASPTLLWEFTDANMGYTYGNPKITKLKDGTWVVLVSSGYNNADGVGRLYVLNANTGVLIRTISTGVGSATTPSGLSRISAHAPTAMTDNTAVAAYGGDTLGSLWRFDINGDIGAAGYDAQLLISFTNAAGTAQPITVKPLEATINGNPVVYVGTGRYLGTTDVTDSSMQSFYAVMDKLGSTPYGSPRNASNGFVQQSLTSTTCPSSAPSTVCTSGQVVRTVTSNVVDWASKNGWYIDFLSAGERSVSDPSLGLGTLSFTTITPQASSVSACSSSTDTSASFAYALDYMTGGAVAGSYGVGAVSLGSGLASRPVLIELSDGTVMEVIRTSGGVLTGTDNGSNTLLTPPIAPVSSSNTRRTSWRELNGK